MDDLISRQAVIDAIKHCECMHIFELQEVIPEINAIPSPQEHDGCKDCRYQDKNNFEMPCFKCKQNYKDLWEREKPTDTITMTREEFNEKLMKHYRQGRADEKAYQNGEIMQLFSPD